MHRAPSADSVFHAISCPTRRALLDTLARGERNVGELVESLTVSQSAVSQQLAILKNAGLVRERSEGRYRYYRLRAAPLDEVGTWLARYRAHVERELDALGRVLDAMPDDPADTAVATAAGTAHTATSHSPPRRKRRRNRHP